MDRDFAQPLPRLAFAAAGGIAFAVSLIYFAVCYVARWDPVPGSARAGWQPAALDLALFTAFALHHSVFARTGAKRWIAQRIPPPLERSVYVWISSVLFVLVCAFWRPVPGRLWDVEGPWRTVLLAGQAVAGVFTLVAARKLDVLDLAGVRQVLRGSARPHGLDEGGPYRLVRHPIYLAWIGLVWLTPVMSGTRLVFAAVSTAYLFVAIPYEERELRRLFGEAYATYSRRVRWRMLPFVY